MNPENNPLYKKAVTPYKDGGEYYLLIQGDYGPHDRPPTPHWVKVKYLVDSQGVGNFVSPTLPRKEDYRIKDVLFKDVSEDNLISISHALLCNREISFDNYRETIVEGIYIDEEHWRAKGFHEGFIRGLEFAEKFL